MDLKLCFDAMQGKQMQHSLCWRYYDGDHPIRFINPKFDQVVPNGTVFKKNWCQVIINATRDRLKVQEWGAESETDALDDIWRKVLKRCAPDVHVSALTTGEAYVVAWPDAQGMPKAYYHDPRQAHALYDDNDPHTMRVACKRWVDGKKHRLNLYYPDRIEHYVALSEPSVHTAYTLESSETNPYGVIPVFHFRTNRRTLTGELTSGVLSLQDGMNKLLNDMMVSSEFCSFPQRWGIGQWETGEKLPIGPATILKIPAAESGEQPASVGTFATTDPGNYLEPIDSLADAMAVLSATPKHYFTGQGANLSGEALQAMEAPLIAKVELYQDILGEEWTRLMAFCAGMETEDIECVWQPPHTVQPQSQASTRLTNTQAGIPIINLLRDEGWSDEQLQQLIEDAALLPVAGATPSAPGPQGTPEEQAAVATATVEKQSTQIRAALLTALESLNVDMVDRLIKNGTLDRMKGTKPA